MRRTRGVSWLCTRLPLLACPTGEGEGAALFKRPPRPTTLQKLVSPCRLVAHSTSAFHSPVATVAQRPLVCPGIRSVSDSADKRTSFVHRLSPVVVVSYCHPVAEYGTVTRTCVRVTLVCNKRPPQVGCCWTDDGEGGMLRTKQPLDPILQPGHARQTFDPVWSAPSGS